MCLVFITLFVIVNMSFKIYKMHLLLIKKTCFYFYKLTDDLFFFQAKKHNVLDGVVNYIGHSI